MKKLIYALSLLGATAAHAQQMDMDAMMKWGAADVIRYHIVGVYQARTCVASDGSGQPDSDNLRISKDKKSLITKKNGWTWTFTPTIVPTNSSCRKPPNSMPEKAASM